MIRVRGLDQLSKYNNIDYANAKLLYDGIDYYIALTCFIYKETTEKQYNNTINVTLTDKDNQKIVKRELEILRKYH